jgi:hypothetical protein
MLEVKKEVVVKVTDGEHSIKLVANEQCTLHTLLNAIQKMDAFVKDLIAKHAPDNVTESASPVESVEAVAPEAVDGQ